MAGYTDSFTRINGDLIAAIDFENEYSTLGAAFNASTGHKHDGTSGEGSLIALIADSTTFNEIAVTTGVLTFSVVDTGAKVSQFTVEDGAILPTLTNDIDLGSNGLQFKDIHATGTANLTTLGLDTGVTVTSILDDDTLAADSDTALVTQQSVKTYIDNHAVSIIELDNNAVEIDAINDVIIMSINTGVKTNKLRVDTAAIFPDTNLGLDIGKDGTFEFNNIYCATVNNATIDGGSY